MNLSVMRRNVITQSSNIFIFLFALNLVIMTSSTGNKQPLWTWECVNDKCEPSPPSPEGKPQSLITCSMLCASMALWPAPTGPVSLFTAAVPVRADHIHLEILSAPSQTIHEHLRDAFKLMLDDLQRQQSAAPEPDEWSDVVVRVLVNGTADPRMRVGTDETYQLSLKSISDTRQYIAVDIYAKSFCGARNAFETLSQLVWWDPYAGSLVALEAALVEDAPRFEYRGLLVDTARSYISVNELLRIVDLMGANKLNTLHWHASDSHAFSLQMDFAPKLTSHGAFSPGAVYSPEDVRAVVRRARLRGVRVLLEVDTPAHVGRAWGWGAAAGLGHLAHCIEAEPWSDYCDDPPCGQLNPRNENVYSLLEKIYAEIIELTGVDDVFHLGGDDVSEHCWNMHFKDTNYMDLWLEFTQKALERLQLANQNRMPNLTIMWSSHLSERIKTDLKGYAAHIGLQTRSAGWAQKVQPGLRTVLSNEDAWDFNDGLGAWFESGEGAPYNCWQRVYENRPWGQRGMEGVVGGEGTVWGARRGAEAAALWARAAALAERLWSDRAGGASRPVHARLDVHRARSLARALPAAPVCSMWCTQHPYTCV